MEIRRKIKILICLCITCALLICIDSYYRESDKPYKEMYPEKHIVTEFETKVEKHNVCVSVYEFNEPQLGDYYKIGFVVGQKRGSFRVFKEEGIEYEKPVIVKKEDSCNIIIKRKNLDDLVYIIPYGKPTEEM